MVSIRQTVVESDGLSLGVREAGDPNRPAFVLLHGWPQTGRSFERVLEALADDFFVLAPDLPGVGESRGAPESGAKRSLAGHVRRLIEAKNARSVVLVGHDAGGMVTFAYMREYPTTLEGGVIMNTVIPGVDPWLQVIANPHIWHFAFHAIPSLPETVVTGREGPYFDFFFDFLAHDKAAITPEARAAYVLDYGRPEALKAGFDWYRAFPEDVKDNASPRPIETPLLYLRGDKEPVDIDAYLAGLRRSGFTHVDGEMIRCSGHFSPDEAPVDVARALRRFRESLARPSPGPKSALRSQPRDLG